jgi:hypothetical protein
VKKFGVISSRYRGHLQKDNGLLEAINGVCVCIVLLQIKTTPLRIHRPLVDAEDEPEIAADAVRLRRDALAALPFEAHLLGDPWADLIMFDDGAVAGHGEEPDNDDVNTFCSVVDFRAGQQVYAWFWGKFYRASVQYVAVRKQTITIRWNWSHHVTAGYLPRLLLPKP